MSERDNPLRVGRVEKVVTDGPDPLLKIHWMANGERSLLEPNRVRNGFNTDIFKHKILVEHIPSAITRDSLGLGFVVDCRTIGDRDQVLVEFQEDSTLRWMPFQNLRGLKDPESRFLQGLVEQDGHAERFRLKTLAHALENWNENTGALARFDIDPLPHQIHLVHHILASGNLNWLIADDVGLGKTIEAGLLLAALKQRGDYKRILLVTPAGLTRQWQEELHEKFGFSDFRIYGTDFTITEKHHWKLYDHVITSLDLIKNESHLSSILAADEWDLVIFDEAHRLSRRQYGLKYQSTDRFRLAQQLRMKTDNFIFLTATPHQGKHDQFVALLGLLRPELNEEFEMLHLEPDILKQMVYRNRKSDVTDADGNFIFHGKSTHAIKVAADQKEIEFDKSLQSYLLKGYKAAHDMGTKGNAIGFVMTIFRKLNASSSAAIHRSLSRRKAKLEMHQDEPQSVIRANEDIRFQGEWEEENMNEIIENNKEFFADEILLLDDLIHKAQMLVSDDKKLAMVMRIVRETILKDSPDKKLVVFTEYKTTQEHIRKALAAEFGEQKVVVIHGAQSLDEKLLAINRFNNEAQFLISTEAGGEGINLHKNCHIMVNYDLPWNPMRLVQRVGRLYRYGQKDKVVVFNLHSPELFDANIVENMYARLDTIVHEMSAVGAEFDSRFHEEVFGRMAEFVDVEQIIKDATENGISRTEDRIQEALERAVEARKIHEDLFESVQHYDPNESKGELVISLEHLKAFVFGMLRQMNCALVSQTHNDKVWEIAIPENLREVLLTKKEKVKITTTRELADKYKKIEMMDFESPLFNLMINMAKSHHFGGVSTITNNSPFQATITTSLRWQNEKGRIIREEFSVIATSKDNETIIVNDPAFSEWLLTPAADGTNTGDRSERAMALIRCAGAADQRLGVVSNKELHPAQQRIIAGAWNG